MMAEGTSAAQPPAEWVAVGAGRAGPVAAPSGSRVALPLVPQLELEKRVMAAVCEVCGKKPSFGVSISHSHVRSKRRWNPNIQRIRAIVNGSPKRMHVCTSCIKAGKIQKAVR